MRKFVPIAIWCILISGVFVLLGFVSKEQAAKPCKGIEIIMNHETENGFIDELDIRTILNDNGVAVKGQKLSSLDIAKMEKVIRNNPFVANAEVYQTIDAEIKVSVQQRRPILRVFNTRNESYYIDENGTFMPTSEKYSADVLAVNGFIYEPFSIKTLDTSSAYLAVDSLVGKNCIRDLFQLAKYIEKNETLRMLIVQAYVTSEGEIELIPRVGNFQIILGDLSGLDHKIFKLIQLYSKGFPLTGWDQYETVNLKYKNQVVCTRKIDKQS